MSFSTAIAYTSLIDMVSLYSWYGVPVFRINLTPIFLWFSSRTTAFLWSGKIGWPGEIQKNWFLVGASHLGKCQGLSGRETKYSRCFWTHIQWRRRCQRKSKRYFPMGNPMEILHLSSSDYFKCPTKGVWLCKLQCWDGARGEKMWIMDGWIVGKIYGKYS